jgi:hypothetical protein
MFHLVPKLTELKYASTIYIFLFFLQKIGTLSAAMNLVCRWVTVKNKSVGCIHLPGDSLFVQMARGTNIISTLNPSAWSDGHCPHTVNITCRGVTGTARHSINITCRGVTGTARMLHALTHSSISRQVREQM